LVEALESDNADLKEKNVSFETARLMLETQALEMQAERDAACEERDTLRFFNNQLETNMLKVSGEKAAGLQEKESLQCRLDKIAAEFESDFETCRSKMEILVQEKKSLEDQVTFLKASIRSEKENAARQLERANALEAQRSKQSRLKAECKASQLRIAELQDEITQLVTSLGRLKTENSCVIRDNRALMDTLQTMSSRDSHLNHDKDKNKRRIVFGFRHGNL